MALADLIVFIKIASGLGFVFIIVSQLITAGIGLFFLRKLDFNLFFFIDAEIKKGQRIVSELWDETWVLTAACLLILPGIISDIVGGLCMIPFVRQLLIRFFDENE